MEYRSFDLTVLSADDLKRVPRFGKMHTYAVAWVSPYERQSTSLSTSSGTKPVWNHKLSFSAPESAFQQPHAHLTIEIYSRGTLGNNFVGSVFVPLADILRATPGERFTYQVKRRSGRARGSLNISVSIGDKTMVETAKTYEAGSSIDTPVMAYPASSRAGYGAYPPPVYGNQGYPPQYPGAYPPQYYPQVQQPVGRRPGFGGGGLGMGLLAGGLGGLLVGDIIGSEMSNDNYGGYDGGYDNSGGFDGGGFDGGFGF